MTPCKPICPTLLSSLRWKSEGMSAVVLRELEAWRLTADQSYTSSDVQNNRYRETHKRTYWHRHSKGVPSITALHLLSGHVAPSVFPQSDGFCRLGGHGTTITSKRPWQHRTNSLTKATSTTHLHSSWHTLIFVCPVFPVDENTGDKFSSATQVCFWGPLQDPVEDTVLDTVPFGHLYQDILGLHNTRKRVQQWRLGYNNIHVYFLKHTLTIQPWTTVKT